MLSSWRVFVLSVPLWKVKSVIPDFKDWPTLPLGMISTS